MQQRPLTLTAGSTGFALKVTSRKCINQSVYITASLPLSPAGDRLFVTHWAEAIAPRCKIRGNKGRTISPTKVVLRIWTAALTLSPPARLAARSEPVDLFLCGLVVAAPAYSAHGWRREGHGGRGGMDVRLIDCVEM